MLHRALIEARVRHPTGFRKALGVVLRGDAAATKQALNLYAERLGYSDNHVNELEAIVQELGDDKSCLLAITEILHGQRVELPTFLTGRLKEVLRGDAASLMAIFQGYITADMRLPTDLLPELLAVLCGQPDKLLSLLRLYSEAELPTPKSLVAALSSAIGLG